MMHTRRMVLLGLLAFTLLGTIPIAHAGEIVWEGSYAAAVKAAKRTGRPIMIDFFADWCGWCKKLDTDVYTEGPVIKASGKFVSVKLNTETDSEGRELAKKYQVSSLPTILFVNAAGEVVGRIQGYRPAPEFAAQMEDTFKTHQEVKNLPTIRALFDRNPNDLKTAVRMAQVYAMAGDADGAKTALARIAKLDPNDAKGQRAKSTKTVAEIYVKKRDVKNAVPLFQEAARIGKSAEVVSYSRLSAAVGLLILNEPRKAVQELMPMFTDSRMQASDRETATNLLSKIPTPLW